MSNSQKPPSLQPNEIIKRTKPDYNWKVIVELGKGGYGTVNKVIKVNEEGFAIDDKEYAMKTEQKFASKHSSRLKIERNVMASYSKCDAQCKEHFPELIDFGQSPVWKVLYFLIKFGLVTNEVL
nr:hypothetical protein ZK507.2 - Caenorhabditis elegans [Caenorhabditis elegans]